MTQRTLAGILAVPLLIALWVAAAFEPLPFVTYEPGVTIDVLGKDHGKEIIEVRGHKAYRDDGQLRMTTVYVSQPDATNNLFTLMRDWVSSDDAIYPRDAVYTKGETPKQNRKRGAQEMTSSQGSATAAALAELGYRVTEAYVAAVTKGAPAAGRLRAGDVVLLVDGTPVTSADDLVATMGKQARVGQPVRFVVRRDGDRRVVRVTPERKDGRPQVGIQVGTRPKPHLPVTVHVHIDPSIGGPSAGLVFALGIYDTLTPGSLTGGKTIAGTGTVDASGHVGPIGGIQQKIVAAHDAGAGLFLVPPDNCQEALGAPAGDMRLVRADTVHAARTAVQQWVRDPDADLPACGEGNA